MDSRASRLTSSQEFTAEELWQPWPEYVAILRDEPERAATITRELFAAKDERLIAFLRSLPWNVDVEEYSPALYASDFPLALLDILTNERWYTLLTSSYYSGFDVFESSLAHELYLVLKFVRRLILIDGGQVLRPGAELCEHYLERFPALWKALWRHREIVLDRSFVKSRGQDEMYALVGYLLECYCSIMEQLRGTVPSISSYAAHVALVIWYKDDGTSTGRPITHHAARIFYEIVQRETSFTRIAFVKETVPLVIGMENSSEVVRRVLSAPGKELLSHWSLHITLTIALLILRGSRPEKKSEEERRETFYALYRVFQRSQCFQITRDESPGTRRNCGAIVHILCTLSMTDEDIMNHDWFDNVDKVDFVQIIALSMRDTCTENDLLGRQTLFSLINGLTRLATRTSTSPEIFRKVAYIRRVLQVHWLPALEELRAVLRQSAQEASPDSTRVVIDLHTMISTWERLGEAYCLSGVSRTHDSVADLTSYLSHEEKTQGCYLTECPCYGRKSPWHKTRLACKGCWAVFYCGRVCQKRDWELGHRDMCPGRRQPARE